MVFFTRTTTADPPQRHPPQDTGRKIILNFPGRGSKAVLDMAAATLEAGGFDPAIAEPKPPEVGDLMKDRTIYAGISPDTGKAMYVMAADEPLCYTFKQAAEQAAVLNTIDAFGHHDWRVPSKAELCVLFNNRAAIGNFLSGWHWSSELFDEFDGWAQRFPDGYLYIRNKDLRVHVRYVR